MQAVKNRVPKVKALLSNRVLVKPATPMEKIGKIIIPEKSREKIARGEVVAIGEGKFKPNSEERLPMTVKIGDLVTYSKYAGSEIELEDEEYLLLSEDDILAIIEDSDD